MAPACVYVSDTCMVIGVVVSAAATLLTGTVYLQLEMLLFLGRAWVFPFTVGLTIPSILTPLFLRCFRPMLRIVECTVDAVVFTFSRIVDILLMLWYIKDSRTGRVALGLTVGLAVLSACGLGYCLVFSVVFLLPKCVLKRTRKFVGHYICSIPYNSFGGGSNNASLPSRCTSLKVLDLHMGPLVMLVQISDLEKEVMGTRALNTLGVHLGRVVQESFMMGILAVLVLFGP